MSQPKYYPPLSDIVSLNDIPDIMSFLKDGIGTLFNKVYYKNLQYSKSPKGDAAFYSLDIVSFKRLSIELPGTGIFIILNPDQQDFKISSLPITVKWEWKVLGYLQLFNLENFSFSTPDVADLQSVTSLMLKLSNLQIKCPMLQI